MTSQALPWIVALPLLLGTTGCAVAGHRDTPSARRAAAWLAGGVALAAFALLLALGARVLAGEGPAQAWPWVPSIGLSLSFRLDGLGLLFAGLILGIGALVVLYAAYYLHRDDHAGKFYAQLMLFMAAMLGIVLTDNLLMLVVFWELTSIASFLLIGFLGHRQEGRDGARMALAITGGGGLAMLAGVVLLGQTAGTFEIGQLVQQAPRIHADTRYPWILGLILIGAFTKSAQLPFHFWLPQAMAAPTPVSAYLHSATMVKAGLFLLLRLWPVIGQTWAFEAVVATTGLATMVFAACVALFRQDLKSLLAYSTISHLGLVTFLIGVESPMSIVAAVLHILNHAAFKAALFMTAGIVDHETKTRDLRRLGGLMAAMPVVGTLAAVAALAMAGIPPLGGFISKELMLEQAVEVGTSGRLWGEHSGLIAAIATLGSAASVAYCLRLVHGTFFGPRGDWPVEHPHEPPWGMKAPVLVLVMISAVLGLAPMLAWPLLRSAAAAALGAPPPEVSLALWHGVNLPLILSGVAVLAGMVVYIVARRWLLARPASRWQAHRVSMDGIDWLMGAAGWVTHRLANGSLQRYLAWMLVAVVVVAAAGFGWREGWPGAGSRPQHEASAFGIALWLALLAACGWLVRGHGQRFIAVLVAGVVGFVAAMAFVAFSAPDLALTQLSVEVVSSVLLLMGLTLLPQTTPPEPKRAPWLRDATIAVAAGLGLALLCWVVLTRDHQSISWVFLDQSVPLGGGTNIVNVILVDFRGYDTFGEIVVLGIAAIGVAAMLDGFRARRPALDLDGRRYSFSAPPLLLQMAARLMLPLALVVSVHIFWRGHNLPGGGFIAGLVTAIALVLQHMALGQARAGDLLGTAGGQRSTRAIAAGIAVAAGTGVAAWLFGRPFLTSTFGHPTLPFLGEMALASAAVFDLGVYICVVAATLLMLGTLSDASREAPEAADARGGRA